MLAFNLVPVEGGLIKIVLGFATKLGREGEWIKKCTPFFSLNDMGGTGGQKNMLVTHLFA